VNDNRTKTAIVTGASSGIGAAFARTLAGRGYHLVLVARRKERLQSISQELAAQYGAQAEVLAADLASAEGTQRVAEHLQKLRDVELLVNNAGFGQLGRFTGQPLAEHLRMIAVHVHAPVKLTYAVLPGMLAQGHGGVINVASLAALIPLRNVMYSATKAYLVAFSEALQNELRDTGIRVQALCPGFTYTEFHDHRKLAGFTRAGIPEFMWGNAGDVVRASLRALEREKVICVPGLLNQILAAFGRNPLTSGLLRFGYRLAFNQRNKTNGK